MKKSLTMFAIATVAALYSVHAEPSNLPSEYPLATCIVSDEKLGEMGKPYVFTYEGRSVQLCCKQCYRDFKEDPQKHLKKLDAAQKGSF